MEHLPQRLVRMAQAQDPGCVGGLREPCVSPDPTHTSPSWAHPVCWNAFIPAGVGETQDTEDAPVLGLCGSWEGVR